MLCTLSLRRRHRPDSDGDEEDLSKNPIALLILILSPVVILRILTDIFLRTLTNIFPSIDIPVIANVRRVV